MELVNKEPIANELKRRIDFCNKIADACAEGNLHNSLEANELLIRQYENLLSFLDTLEVKEVDLELNSFDATVCKIGSTYLKEMDRDAIAKALEPYKDGDKVKVIIKAKGE